MTGAYVQPIAPVGASLAWSALVAVLPLLTMLVLLAVFRFRSHSAAAVAVAVAVVVATTVYGMPVGSALSAGVEGAVFGLFPIMWTVVNAVFVYRLTVESGHFDVLTRAFGRISPDPRILTIVIAFLFGALLEAVAGFGTPIVVSTVVLIGAGLPPVRAAAAALLANSVVTPLGVMGTPILTMSRVSEIPIDEIGPVVARQVCLLAVFVPLVLVAVIDGRRGVRQTWPIALAVGLAFGGAQFVCASYLTVGLSNIAAAAAGLAVLLAVLKVWQPRGESRELPGERIHDSRRRRVEAFAPYALIVLVFLISRFGPVASVLSAAKVSFAWPGVDVTTEDGRVPTAETFTFDLLSAPGTLVFVAAVLSTLVLRVAVSDAARCFVAAVVQLRWSFATVTAVLALAYVMNLSGQTGTIGSFLAGAGAAFALVSPVLGWLGVVVTGSNTASNAMFGSLQVAAAQQSGLDPTVLVAGNMTGGTTGTPIALQNLALVSSVKGLSGKDGLLMRRIWPLSIAGLVVLALLVWLQTTSVLSWMLP
ncbi:lactate permease LctP family transporter [Rhodococcus sp. Z13]|uniref:Lactate permease LctP family transporter n=1 Tax=Rhodococcus sacchari TaxID=2962047 RepID=A0ACD4DHR3_9NOCA|nr:lactate permease LctP family transporter [Rhodococcus sp. Z13]UYP19537.1 lactate permease LctP family transporter [Rhodococcus sp. Z13]